MLGTQGKEGGGERGVGGGGGSSLLNSMLSISDWIV